MKGGVFAYESDGDRLVKVFLGRCECAPGVPGLIAFLNEEWGDGEFVEAKDVSEMSYKALFFKQKGNYMVNFKHTAARYGLVYRGMWRQHHAQQ